MKKKPFLSAIMAVSVVFAMAQTNTFSIQDSSKMTRQRWRDTCFALLNLTSSQIPSGYLIDYSLNPFNDSNFNSLVNTKIDTILDAGNFFQLHNILSLSVVNSSASSIGTTDSLFINSYRYKRDHGTMPLMFLYQPFQKIRSSAYSQGLMTFTPDSFRLKDVAGRSSSPYDSKLMFAFSPFQTQISQYTAITFALPSQLWLMPGVTSVQVDFGDGVGFRTLSPNSTASVSYNNSGTYYLTAKISTSNGMLTAKSSIQFTKPLSYATYDSIWNISVAPKYTSIANYISSHQAPKGTAQPLGTPVSSCNDGSVYNAANCDIYPGATVYIQNGCDRVFDKPIIIVEGFDPAGTTTFNTLRYQFSYNPTNGNQAFYDQMRASGYDLVFVIFTKNADFIDNNALVLEQVIQKVNSVKTGTNKSSVIGFSMGGLIARWALRDMENKGINPQVANYFSYDAPHQGANIPVSLQCLLNEIIYDLPMLKYISNISQILNSYSSIAAQQLLATYATYSGSQLSSSPLTTVRALFAQDLINLGYPQTTSNYAISNGRGDNPAGSSSSGVGTQFGNFGPGSGLFQGGVIFYLDNFSSNAYAVPSNSTGLILRYRFSGLKAVRIFNINIFSVWAVRVKNISYTSANPYDDAPGGYENTQAQFVYNFNSKSQINLFNTGATVTFYNNGGANSANDYGHFGHNFIPVASALDLQNQGYGSSNNYQSNNMYYAIDNNIVNKAQLAGNTLSPSTLSPFLNVLTYTSDCPSGEYCQSYTYDPFLTTNYSSSSLQEGSSWNLWHEAYISNQTALFMQRRILNLNTFGGCSAYNSTCGLSSSISISGPADVCTTASYTLANYGGVQGLSIQWSITNGKLQITSGQGTPTINVSKLGTGNETITAVLTNSCGQTATYTMTVYLGVPTSPTFITIGPDDICQEYRVSTDQNLGATSYTWQFHLNPYNNNEQIFPNLGYTTRLNLNQGNGTYSIGVSAVNACGSSGMYYITQAVSCSSGHVVISPNPTTGMATVSTQDDSQTASASQSKTTTQSRIYQIKILNTTGTVLKQFNYSGGVTSITLDLSSLLNGVYTMQTYNNTTWNSQQFVIIK